MGEDKEQRSSVDVVRVLRVATESDVRELSTLIDRSVRSLSASVYTAAQVEAALTHIFGVDTQLIADGTYYVIESGETIVAAGGWSARQTLFGGDHSDCRARSGRYSAGKHSAMRWKRSCSGGRKTRSVKM